jgi:hypothetical protein
MKGVTGALAEHPEIAQRIGYLMGFYASIEYHMFIAFTAIATSHFANLTHEQIDDCFAAFYEQRSVNNKSGLALKLAEPRLDKWRFGAWQKLWRRFKGASSRRTEVAHCVFMGSKATGLMRLKVVGREPVFEPLTHDFFDRTSRQFRTLDQDILVFVSFVLRTPERLESLLRVLPLPINIPFPEIPARLSRGPQEPHEKDDVRDSVYRLGLAALYEG